jgi:hypothetical protein
MRPSFVLRLLMLLGGLAAIGSAVGALIARGRLTSSGGPADDELDLVAIFEPLDVASTAGSLRRVTVTSWYGGGTLDLRAATLDPAGATITARSIFGGLQLVLPETWRVELRSVGFMGGAADSRDTSRVDPAGPLLTVHSSAVFGGVGITSDRQGSPETAPTPA